MTDAPSTAVAKTESPAEKQRARMEALLAAIEARSSMLITLLGESGITFARFTEVVRRALIKNPSLVDADAGSFVEACINACTDGLLPDGRQGAIVIYNVNVAGRNQPKKWAKKANWQPMYQGLLKVAYASGNFKSIECRVVYDGDPFEYDLGDEPFIKHRPKSRPAGVATPPIVAAYAVAKTVNGGVFREVFEGADIAKVNAVSRATEGPAKDWPEEMARKGPLRRMWKFLPRNEAMDRITDHDNDGFDLQDAEAPEAIPRERRLAPGFAQLAQGGDPGMPEIKPVPEEDFMPVAPGHEAQEGEHVMHQATSGTFGAPPEPEVASEPPSASADSAAIDTLRVHLATANSWLNAKQALKTFRKGDGTAALDAIACGIVWERMTALLEGGADKTDFISDPILFECWLASWPEPEAVSGNWAIVQQDKAWAKLPEEDRVRIAAKVAQALEP